jgi:AraC family transcriptional regulator, regulatory protein of adaptative response / methylphosphotriester-DNA alkyltransferase methyltransferase
MPEVLVNDKKVISLRQKEIVASYLKKLDAHIDSLKLGKEDKALEIGDFADMLHVHPVHLSNTIKAVTGQSTCSLYEERLVSASKELLLTSGLSIKEIAMRLTYDPSNFTKFFKHFVGVAPKKFREANVQI